jgi:hypothetical protein
MSKRTIVPAYPGFFIQGTDQCGGVCTFPVIAWKLKKGCAPIALSCSGTDLIGINVIYPTPNGGDVTETEIATDCEGEFDLEDDAA